MPKSTPTLLCNAAKSKWVSKDECKTLIDADKCPFFGACLEKRKLDAVLKGGHVLPRIIVGDDDE